MAKVKSEAQLDYSSLLVDSIDEISRRQGYDSDPLEDSPPMSTGLLALDLLYGGGIRPAWFTNFGPEQSAKTTGALTIMAAALKAKVPIVAYSDFEGSTRNSKPYVSSILKTGGVKDDLQHVFGVRDDSGKWKIPPLVRYRAETVGEKFFDWLAAVLRSLPDKKKINGKWWLVFEKNKANQAKVGEFHNPSMAKKYGDGLWVPAEDGNLQAVVLVDSYPAMNPTANDEEEANNSLALQARMFSKHLPRVKGRLASKMVAVIGVNQLRAVPMARYGPTEAEPGGVALKFNSDVRTRFYPRNSGQPLWPKFSTETRLEEEPSVEVDGTDQYRYIHVKAIKNKLWTPQRQGWLRIWVEDAHGRGRGFDPVFDTIFYLRETGQLQGKNRRSLTLNLEGLGESKKTIPWIDLKRWILGDREAMKEISTKHGFKPMSLRAYCFKQMRDGVAEKLYLSHKNATKGSKDEEEGGD